ncbi:4'-phosphopantetheinyl transferase superfamily protein [Winogradskyella luteola]|uniref:4'-phosphopantetheinyl transferase superfamily protein n=1 Tax=Winogradskyella luteola TaxID=2828330 RepID=A0A9X1F8H7_9FLAO|nr:4'-phosphopantetheinyl transferase superfamily protein [Winogradskyella luteola]MBV7269046.1 4'-phosphopantetheinyl transferase superfamily protein [Winogradskyella luteola]
MVGNDIVDLKEAQNASSWQRPRFLDKLFTDIEQTYIENSNNPFTTVWRLWSMKEAAYKLFIQQNPDRFYNPKKFECRIEKNSGIVKFQTFRCYVETKITSDYVLSEARCIQNNLTSEVLKFEDKNQKMQSVMLKRMLMNALSETLKIPKTALIFRVSKLGTPSVSYNNKIINVSLTHHGNYGAFALGV